MSHTEELLHRRALKAQSPLHVPLVQMSIGTAFSTAWVLSPQQARSSVETRREACSLTSLFDVPSFDAKPVWAPCPSAQGSRKSSSPGRFAMATSLRPPGYIYAYVYIYIYIILYYIYIYIYIYIIHMMPGRSPPPPPRTAGYPTPPPSPVVWCLWSCLGSWTLGVIVSPPLVVVALVFAVC